MSQPLWTNTLGLLSTVVLIGFWTFVLIPIPLGGVMLTLFVGLAFSLAAALKGSRWWFLAATGLSIVVVSGLH